jgi:ABC-type bacteriocin/lantibiotic exporter with double-glycine peptidase domain
MKMLVPSAPTLNDALLCTSSLLGQMGVDTSAHALKDRLGPSPSQESWAELVRAHGRSARLVRVTPGALKRLPLPTLLLRDGVPYCVVRSLRGNKAVVELADGTQVSEHVRTVIGAGVSALEVGVTLSGLASFRARMLRLLSWERTTLLHLVFSSILLAALGLLAPLLTREVMDQALPNHASQMLLAIVAAVLLTGLTRSFFSWLRDRITIALNARNGHTLLRDGLAHALGLPYATLSREGLGGLLQGLSSTESLGRLVTGIGLRPVLDGVFGLVSLAVIAQSAPLLSAALLLASTLALGVASLIARRHASHRKDQLSATARERARLHELVSGIDTIKAASAERHCVERWLSPMLDQSLSRLHAELTGAWYALWLSFFSRASRVAMVVWGAEACLAGELSIGSFVALSMLSDNFVGSTLSLGDALLGLSSARSDVDRVDALLEHKSAPLLSPHASRPVAAEPFAVVMDDVWFRYGPEQPWILKGYSLRLRAGEQLTLRSASGSGKTTILRLIAGLYRPERGTISVFGRDPGLSSAQIAYLPQQAHLFAGSLLHNLRLLSGASLERIVQASVATGLAAFVATLPMKFETIVPAGGGNLSGGQRQWILLTAAVASERRLLLMDESLANLDRLTRARLRQGASFDGKSVIWVSHED